jgi:predicted nucleotidyltransferase
MTDVLHTTLADAVRWLEGEGLPYALIGGIAVSIHGQPRATADVDLVIAADIPRALRLLKKLPESPFRPLFDGAAEVVERAFILPIRHATTGIKVDLAIGLSGFEQQAIERAEPTLVGGHSISVATAEDLIIMKMLAGRAQDTQDVRGIVAARQDDLDWDYCLRVAAELEEAVEQDLVAQVRELREGV